MQKVFLSYLIFLASLDSNSFLAFLSRLACHLPWTMPNVALIGLRRPTASTTDYHPTSAALIIGRQLRQGRRSIYPNRSIFTARCRSNVSVCLPHAGIISKHIKISSIFSPTNLVFHHHMVAKF